MIGFRKTTAILAGTLLLASGAGLYLYTTPALNTKETVQIYVNKQDNSEELIDHLTQSYALKFPFFFRMLANRMHLGNGLKNGRYTIPAGTNMVSLVRIFREGKTKTSNLTIRPLMGLDKLAAKCGDKLEPDSAAYMQAFKDSAKLHAAGGFTLQTVYALPIPDTYNLLWHTDPDELLAYLKKAYDQFWNPARISKLNRCGLTQIQVSVLASIVAKETNKYDEMPVIAGMYINRLRMDMPLQADPTVKFALNDPGIKRIYSGHLQVVSPYNTYLVKGLPPGPICIPPVQAIDAVLDYTSHNFVFMCAREDFSGYHNFATDYASHLKNAARYRKALDERGIQ